MLKTKFGKVFDEKIFQHFTHMNGTNKKKNENQSKRKTRNKIPNNPFHPSNMSGNESNSSSLLVSALVLFLFQFIRPFHIYAIFFLIFSHKSMSKSDWWIVWKKKEIWQGKIWEIMYFTLHSSLHICIGHDDEIFWIIHIVVQLFSFIPSLFLRSVARWHGKRINRICQPHTPMLAN